LTGFQQGMHEYEDEADGIAAGLQLRDRGVHGGVVPIAACRPVDRVAKGQGRVAALLAALRYLLQEDVSLSISAYSGPSSG
jgi:hypothetical protein